MPDTTTRTPDLSYRGAAGASAPRLTALPGVHDEEVVPQRVLEIERFDTDDLRLAAAGITLAVHRDPDGPGQWRLDLPDGETTERLRVPVAPDAPVPPTVPDELAELVRGAARDRAVHPVGQVRTVRTATRLLGEDGVLLAVVVHDHLTLATLGRSTEVESWTETSIQEAAADDALLVDLQLRLRDAGLRPAAPAAEAELDRLLRPAPPARSRTAGRRGSAGAVLLDYLGTQVDRLAAEDLRVRRGEPDAVHQMRVAARRIRSALQSYRPLLDRERTDPIVDELRELGRALAPARDAEVLHARISDGLAALPSELLLGPAQAQVTRYFGRVEAEAGAAVLSTLDGDRYEWLRTALDELVADPPLTARAGRPARKELPAITARSARKLRRAVRAALDPGVADRDIATHSARKAGKRLRYATEVVRPAVGKPAKRFVSRLKGLQKALGEHQDTVVARATLRELGALAHAAGENGFSFGVLHGQDAARAARIEEDLAGLWERAWDRRGRRWLR